MAKQLFLNNFTTTFIAAVKDSPSTGIPATELDYGVLRISDGAAGALINPSGGDFYVLTAFKRSGSTESNIEVLRVTAVDNSTPGECRITVARAQEGTTAKAYVSGDYLSLRLTKGSAERFTQPDELADKVDKVAGKGLSTEDYTTAEKTKLAGVEAGAQVNTVTSVAGKTGAVALAQADVGLANVDNTADADKPVSTAQASALAGKEASIAAGTASQFWRGDKTWQDFATSVRAAVLTGLSTATSTVVAATDSVLAAIGKLQAQVSLRAPIAEPSFTNTATFQGVKETLTTANTGTAYTVANTAASILDLTLTGNCLLTYPAPSGGGQFTLLLKQDATGSRTVTWPSTVRWAGGTAPTITATVGRTDVVAFLSDGTYWLGFVGGLNFTRA